MRRIAIAAVFAGAALAGPAWAQNPGAAGGGYGGFGSVGGGPDYGGPPMRQRPVASPETPPPPGRVCVTRAGSCAAGPARRGARCACRPSGASGVRGTIR
jgi:hypothetical protein